jgi:hypothetical protein
VTNLSQRLLAHHGGLRGLVRMASEGLRRIRGLGAAKCASLIAALGQNLLLVCVSPQPMPSAPDPAIADARPGRSCCQIVPMNGVDRELSPKLWTIFSIR